jgi:hypothetical protein
MNMYIRKDQFLLFHLHISYYYKYAIGLQFFFSYGASAHVGHWPPLMRFLNSYTYRQLVGLLDESARRKAATYTGQHKHRINADIHAHSGIRTHDPSVRAEEDISCLRPRGHRDRL